MKLEYIGQPGPHRDIQGWCDRIRAAHPGITDVRLEHAIRQANAKYRPRMDDMPFIVWGEDIMTHDLSSIEAWPYLIPLWRRELPLYPVQGGAVLDVDDERRTMTLQGAIASMGPRNINRRSLIVPRGIRRTYVWCNENQWTQEVLDHDVKIIRETPIHRHCFQSAEVSTGELVLQGYERLPREKIGFRTMGEFRDFERESERKTLYRGATL